MHFIRNLYYCLIIIYIQTPCARSISASSTIQEKLRSIRQWLDTTHDATAYDYIYRVNKGAGLNLFEGDIKGYNPRHSQLRTAVTNHQLLWNTRVVPYTIDSSFGSASRKEILAGIDEYHNKTCLRFKPRTTESDYVHIKQISGCYSNVGRTGGEQDLSLAGPCLKKGTAIHELMHALGFWHEQSRPDRDSWIHVVRSNIQTGKEYNFDKLSSNEVDTLGEQYDYGSVMHYSKYAFSKNGNPTIIPSRKTDAELGQREGLSEHDVHRINTLYRCDTHAATIPATSTPVTVNKFMTTKQAPTKRPHTSKQAIQIISVVPTSKAVVFQSTPSPNTKSTTKYVPPHSVKPGIPTPQVSLPAKETTKWTAKLTTRKEIFSSKIQSWTAWSRWTPCDLQCKHNRYRFCLNYDSSYCPGNNSESRDCPYSCKRAVSLGCWKENGTSPLIPTAEKMDIILTDYYKHRSMAIRKCADFAAKNGFTVFALFDGGMCRTGASAYIDYSKGGPSRGCTYKGTGSKDSSNVYSFVTDINGGWSPWTGWSQCTKTCGQGQQYRYRSCDNPTPTGKGSRCLGNHRDIAICNVQYCQANVKCGRQFHIGPPGASGLIWVRDYENFMECEYQIMTADPQSTISLLIQDMDVEYSKGCIYDTLMLYDGNDKFSPFVGAFCGRTSPGSFESTSNNVYLKFESDETKTGSGFTVFYTINNRSKKACVRPPASSHVTIRSEGNMVGNRVFYQCHPGYNMVGHSPIKCLDQPGFALWDDVFPRCVSAKKRSTYDLTKEKICTFESSMCGFKPHKLSDFDWRVDKYNNNSVLITKSSRLQAPGDVSRIISGEQDSGIGKSCVHFRYIIDGGADAVLNIYFIHAETQTGAINNTHIWGARGMEADDLSWKSYSININVHGKFQIMFEAILWEEIGSQVIIDDIRISGNACF